MLERVDMSVVEEVRILSGDAQVHMESDDECGTKQGPRSKYQVHQIIDRAWCGPGFHGPGKDEGPWKGTGDPSWTRPASTVRPRPHSRLSLPSPPKGHPGTSTLIDGLAARKQYADVPFASIE
jgi:hypothetical protein